MPKKKIFAQAQPNGDGHQVSYETGGTRRVHHFPKPERVSEPSPHAAGSFHNPEHHHELIERFEAYLKEQS
ncbi:hypothetical protein DDZ13_03480 [Coraliomargarita sinensis]|uniref:Uncharacterized protein n=1 Tax=Coraliomargarita sinensis TaxID=2174842 RepID=A0A317ZM78_9BACT|nr:hypothetical protein [Coraliomargarita sinensis]PXA05038.1 hypothetical protein DDZ13_03480 [Coraliomargarita sinensis]